jgi:hypothetical protein
MSAPPRTPVGLRAPGCPDAAERIYRLLLRTYPPDFRARYGREMILLFRDQCREADAGAPRFWAAVIWDVARSAPALRAEMWRARGHETTGILEAIMKLAATLTVLLGVYVAVGALAEAMGGVAETPGGRYLLAIVLGGLAGALLLAAGIALLRRTPTGRQAARLALVASLAIVVTARLVHPWMSIFSQLVGMGLPVALLIALHWPRRPSASGAP